MNYETFQNLATSLSNYIDAHEEHLDSPLYVATHLLRNSSYENAAYIAWLGKQAKSCHIKKDLLISAIIYVQYVERNESFENVRGEKMHIQDMMTCFLKDPPTISACAKIFRWFMKKY